jgi:uncharacterized repeat protein (TIGR01451 family)
VAESFTPTLTPTLEPSPTATGSVTDAEVPLTDDSSYLIYLPLMAKNAIPTPVFTFDVMLKEALPGDIITYTTAIFNPNALPVTATFSNVIPAELTLVNYSSFEFDSPSRALGATNMVVPAGTNLQK